MSWLLQWYIFRELGKTFLLWAVGLTMVFALCGGVLNMIQVEGATAIQMAEILGFVLPVAMTLTLPVSALISTALTYGRLSADNEFNACRSSGINIHVLFLPSLVISLGVALFTFSFSNYIIPRFIGALEQMARKDLHKIVTSQLKQKGFLKAENYVIYADLISQDPTVLGTSADDPQRKEMLILGGAFIELKGGTDWLRFGTAKSAAIQFDNSGENPTVRANLSQVRGFDRARNEYFEESHQTLGPYPIPRTFEMKAKWLDLPGLLYFRENPQKMPEIENRVRNLRNGTREALFHKFLVKTLVNPPHVFSFASGPMKGELRSESISIDPKTGRPRLNKPTLVQTWPDRNRKYAADSANARVRVDPSQTTSSFFLALDGSVELRDSRSLNPKEPIKKNREDLGPFPLPAEVIRQSLARSDQDLLGRSVADLSRDIENFRVSTNKEITRIVLDMTGIIHARSAFSASVFVLVILGAALGIIFRGADYLTAFFVSFLPGLFIVVSIIMGRQLAENVKTTGIGIAVIWGVIALVAAVDAVVVTRFLKR